MAGSQHAQVVLTPFFQSHDAPGIGGHVLIMGNLVSHHLGSYDELDINIGWEIDL
jgi:hypothetical protein